MKEEEYTHMFISLIYSLQMQTMIHLGKIANPATGKVETELDAAQATIDMVDMLKAKTLNNLSDDEKRFLDQVLADLKLNFVDEKNKAETSEDKKTEETKSDDTTKEKE